MEMEPEPEPEPNRPMTAFVETATLSHVNGWRYEGDVASVKRCDSAGRPLDGVPHGQGVESWREENVANEGGSVISRSLAPPPITPSTGGVRMAPGAVAAQRHQTAGATRTRAHREFGDSRNIPSTEERYTGEFRNGQREGKGTWTAGPGRSYTGRWRDGLRHGEGTETWSDGRKYTGQYRKGAFHIEGTESWPDGRRYQGAFFNGLYRGKGTYTKADGSSYEGDWHDGKRHGQGTESKPDGTWVYQGQWQNDMRDGQGKSRSTDALYTGGFCQGKMAGNGLMLYSHKDGRRYDGQYKDGRKHGDGTYVWANGNVYVGRWFEGKMHGQGTLTFPDGASYEGEWKDGAQCGQGVARYPDGSEYNGEVRVCS